MAIGALLDDELQYVGSLLERFWNPDDFMRFHGMKSRFWPVTEDSMGFHGDQSHKNSDINGKIKELDQKSFGK